MLTYSLLSNKIFESLNRNQIALSLIKSVLLIQKQKNFHLSTFSFVLKGHADFLLDQPMHEHQEDIKVDIHSDEYPCKEFCPQLNKHLNHIKVVPRLIILVKDNNSKTKNLAKQLSRKLSK